MSKIEVIMVLILVFVVMIFTHILVGITTYGSGFERALNSSSCGSIGATTLDINDGYDVSYSRVFCEKDGVIYVVKRHSPRHQVITSYDVALGSKNR